MIERFDHIVLSVRLEATLSFYERVLGFKREIRPDAPAWLKFGRQKIMCMRAIGLSSRKRRARRLAQQTSA